ncbi:hypothetical protein C942_00366 [Photobacterium marinum]|uniref:Uncharacterized protein n=1 Tax=Photobacterium marinum TaxID=1056511 RepID=L8JBG6_9GAMM|nr:hypothetical protein C942_00366 [Photobacterium marinum]
MFSSSTNGLTFDAFAHSLGKNETARKMRAVWSTVSSL